MPADNDRPPGWNQVAVCCIIKIDRVVESHETAGVLLIERKNLGNVIEPVGREIHKDTVLLVIAHFPR